jgi:hypothetical protein
MLLHGVRSIATLLLYHPLQAKDHRRSLNELLVHHRIDPHLGQRTPRIALLLARRARQFHHVRRLDCGRRLWIGRTGERHVVMDDGWEDFHAIRAASARTSRRCR